MTACSQTRPDWGAALDELSARIEGSIGQPDASGFTAPPDPPQSARSLAEIEAARLTRLQVYNKLQTIDPGALPPTEAQKYYGLYDRLGPLVELDRFAMGGAEAPGPYLLTDRHGAYVTVIRDLSEQPVSNREAADAWLASLADAATAIETETQRFRVETATGVIPPRSIIERAIADLDIQLDSAHEPAVLTHFRSQIAQQTNIPQFESTRLADEARTIYAGEVAPALAELRQQFAALADTAPTEPGVWAQPDGAARYEALFAFYTTAGLSPEDIATLADTTIEDASIEADALLTAIGLVEGSVGQRLNQLATTPQETLQEEREEAPQPAAASSPAANPDAAMAERVNQRFDWARNNLAQMITAGGIRPLKVHSTTLQPHAPRWPVKSIAQPDPTATDTLRFDPEEFAAWPDWSLPVQAYAEALPGRHLIASQRSFAHPLRNGAAAAMSDGWALYATGLASDLGGYDDRPEDRIGYVQYTILQAGLAATDIGIHQQHWPRTEAIDYLQAATGLPREALASFVDEIIRRPGQSAAAFAGNEAIWNFRDRADRRLGPAFDLRHFHDIILAGGPRPIPSVERDVERWIGELETPPPAN